MASGSVRILFTFVGLILLIATPVRAQYSPNEMLCGGLIPAQPDERVVACTAVIEAGGDVTRLSYAHCNRGNAFQARGHLDRAIADYDQSVKLNPNSIIGYNCRAKGNHLRNAFDAAIADFNEAIALDPNSPEAAPAFVGRGNAYLAKGDIDHAIADYGESIRLNPADAMGFNNRGLAMTHKRNYDGAIDDFNNAIRLDPAFSQAFVGRGDVFLRQRDFERAIKDYTDAIRLDPKNAAAYQGLGFAYRMTGDVARANAAFDQQRVLVAK
jgi:tetratricopeptide (TPR) repeat protein